MNWLGKLLSSIVISVSSLLGFQQTEPVSVPAHSVTQQPVHGASTAHVTSTTTPQLHAETGAISTSSPHQNIIDPLIAEVIRAAKPGFDVIPDCHKDPTVCEVRISKEEAIKRIAQLAPQVTFVAVTGSTTRLEAGYTGVSAHACSRGGGTLDQNGFFWTFGGWPIDGLVQVNVSTGESGVCKWPLGDH